MRQTARILAQTAKMLEYYSSFQPSPLSMKQFIDFGKSASEKASFSFLHQELPVRLANIMAEIDLLPETLLEMPSVKLVQSWYERSFEELMPFAKMNPDSQVLDNFCDVLVRIRNRHSSVVQTMAEGILELKESHAVDSATEGSIQYFLDRFYMSRISIRMLINQHTLLFYSVEQESGRKSAARTLLFGGEVNVDHRHIGCIDPSCDVVNVIKDAYENARFLCDQYYLTSPELMVKTHNSTCKEKKTLVTLVYVPSHLYHMLFELFKNAMRATVENHGVDCPTIPPIEVLVAKGKEDLSIRMSDRGGGIPRGITDLLFQYMYSTAPQPSPSGSGSAPLAGYGYGLPLSRLYARYFQGDLIVSSFEGYGTDATIYLKLLSHEANELLPIFNKNSSRHYTDAAPAPDWSSPMFHGRGGHSNAFHVHSSLRSRNQSSKTLAQPPASSGVS
ncbi:unnamed protein product [Cyprideis torosa]|uniref:Protein-serine/threonine kinase n=1 Tax=Cyprideis torosa TaxID=163714 RepID=A0A7R8WF32_9CRUS|nr:unnamed protein product [Cyprideis torosa]CAG0896522.1 unnamed protein product [Cyprideis torosa]